VLALAPALAPPALFRSRGKNESRNGTKKESKNKGGARREGEHGELFSEGEHGELFSEGEHGEMFRELEPIFQGNEHSGDQPKDVSQGECGTVRHLVVVSGPLLGAVLCDIRPGSLIGIVGHCEVLRELDPEIQREGRCKSQHKDVVLDRYYQIPYPAMAPSGIIAGDRILSCSSFTVDCGCLGRCSWTCLGTFRAHQSEQGCVSATARGWASRGAL
jgi:hypothetical protein